MKYYIKLIKTAFSSFLALREILKAIRGSPALSDSANSKLLFVTTCTNQTQVATPVEYRAVGGHIMVKDVIILFQYKRHFVRVFFPNYAST
jgi:hypothetical protein